MTADVIHCLTNQHRSNELKDAASVAQDRSALHMASCCLHLLCVHKLPILQQLHGLGRLSEW